LALRDDCYLHNKLGNAGEVAASEIGPNLAWIGTQQYESGKFGNAILVNAVDVNARVTGAFTGFDANAYIVEMWVKPDWDCVSGRPSIAGFLDPWHYFIDANNFTNLTFNQGAAFQNYWAIRVGGVFTNWTIGEGDWTADDLVHLMWVYDRNGIGGGANTRRFYQDGVLLASSNIATANQAATAGTFYLGNFRTGGEPWKGGVDNIKVYQPAGGAVSEAFITSVIAVKDIEGWIPDAVTGVAATDGDHTTHVAVTWTDVAWYDEYNVYRSTDDSTYFELSGWTSATSYNDTSATPGVTYYYKVKAKTLDGGEGALSASDSGWRDYRIDDVPREIKRPKVLVLNSEIDLYELGYIDKLGKITEQKTFQRDKIVTVQTIIPVTNIDNQFNPDNPSSIFSNINWRYQPVKRYDEDNNLILDGLLDDFQDDQNGKRTGMVVKSLLFKFLQTKIAYTSSGWETPGDAWKNICDNYDVPYNKKHITESIAVYNDNNCFIKCDFTLQDGATIHQALEKIAKVGAADCYTSKNELCYKLWVPFTGGVKFSLDLDDLKVNVKSKLSRIYYNNYVIGYNGDGGNPAVDADNNYIGEVSVEKNGSQDFVYDGTANQQIEVKDLVSAVFLGEQKIKRTHIKLDTKPFPPLIIDFSLPYNHKDFINLQSYFRLTLAAKGWASKLFEVFKNTRDYSGRALDITAYEVDE
jgi:hypothetical protein